MHSTLFSWPCVIHASFFNVQYEKIVLGNLKIGGQRKGVLLSYFAIHLDPSFSKKTMITVFFLNDLKPVSTPKFFGSEVRKLPADLVLNSKYSHMSQDIQYFHLGLVESS
jgi:hypothetical protein